jgi:NADH:ubiquinone oxidoreductase subunit 2 (subunit N)
MVDLYSGINVLIFTYLIIFTKIVYIIVLFTIINVFSILKIIFFVKFLFLITLFLGFLLALFQTKIKKLIISLSIYNLAFFSIAFWNFSLQFTSMFLLFSIFYLANTLALLLIFFSIKDYRGNSFNSIFDLANLKEQNPLLALYLILFLLISSGLPPASLFFIKFSLFFLISQQLGFSYLIFFLIASTLAFFIYLRLVKIILLNKKTNFTLLIKPPSFIISLILSLILLFNLYFIFFFDKILLLLNILLLN